MAEGISCSPTFTIFIHTNLDTRLAMFVSSHDTVAIFKGKIRTGHLSSFPNIGEIFVREVKVRRRGSLYHLPDPMLIKCAFEGIKGAWLLYVDLVSAASITKIKSEAARNVMNESSREKCHILQTECSTAFSLPHSNSRNDLPASGGPILPGRRNDHVSKTFPDALPEKVANNGASAVIGDKYIRTRKRSSIVQKKKKHKRLKEAFEYRLTGGIEDQLTRGSFDSSDSVKNRVLNVEKDYDESRIAAFSAEKTDDADLRRLKDSSLEKSEGDHGHRGTKSFTIVSGEVAVNLISVIGDLSVSSNSKHGMSKHSKKTSRTAELSVPIMSETVSSFLKGGKEPTESLEEFKGTFECNYSYQCNESNDTTVAGEITTNLDSAIAASTVPALHVDEKSKHRRKTSGKLISTNQDPIKKVIKVIEMNPKETMQISSKYLGQESKLVTIHTEFADLGGSTKLDSVVASNTNGRSLYALEKKSANSELVCPLSINNGLEISSVNEHKHENLETNLGMFNKPSANVLNTGINPDETTQNLFSSDLSNRNLDGFFNESCDKCKSLQLFAEKVAEDNTKRSEKALEECGRGTTHNMINIGSAELIEANNHMELMRTHSDEITFMHYFTPKISQHLGNESIDATISIAEVPVLKNSNAFVRSSHGCAPVTQDHSSAFANVLMKETLDNLTVLSHSSEESNQFRERFKVTKISNNTKRSSTGKSIKKKTSLTASATIFDGARSESSDEELESNSRQSIFKDALDSCTSAISNENLEEPQTTNLQHMQYYMHAPGVEPIASYEPDKGTDGGRSIPLRSGRKGVMRSAAGEEFWMGDDTSSKGLTLDDLFAAFVYKGKGVGRDQNPPIKRSPNSVLSLSKTRPRKEKSFVPSSHLVTVINGERRVVSSYFKLPPGASTPVVLDRRDVERAYKARLKPQQKLLDRFLQRLEKVKSASATELEDLDRTEKLRNYRRRKQRSVLSPEEKKMDVYKRLDGSSSWVPPPSPFGLLQEKHYYDPWRVLLICMLLNITTNHQVRGVLESLFLKCPTAEAVIEVQEEELQQMLKPLGLQNKRARAIKIFSQQYLGTEWTHVTQLHGVGKYAADAYAIFCVGKPEEVIPQDHKLVDYWKFVCEHNEKQEQQVCFDKIEL